MTRTKGTGVYLVEIFTRSPHPKRVEGTLISSNDLKKPSSPLNCLLGRRGVINAPRDSLGDYACICLDMMFAG